jgi:hypothetical protein
VLSIDEAGAPTDSNARGRLQRALTWVFVLGAIAALFYVARRDLAAVRAYHWRIQPALLMASLLLQVAVLVAGVYIWSRVVVAFNSTVSMGTLFRMWALSNPIRYIPGSVWQLFAYGKFAGEARLSRSLVFSSLMVHIWLSIWAAVVLVLALAPIAVLPSVHFPRWVPLVIPAVLVVIHPAAFNVAQRIVARILRREAMLWQGGWARSVAILAMDCAAWLASGCAYALFVRSIIDVSSVGTLTLVAVNSISFVVGYVVLFAPAGLGVRELTMSVLLGGALPSAVAVLVAVAARIWIVTAELVCALIALAIPVRNPE